MMVISGKHLKGQKASELVSPQIALLAFTTLQHFLESVWPKNCGFKKWVGRENAFLLSIRLEDLAENSDSLDEFAVKSH